MSTDSGEAKVEYTVKQLLEMLKVELVDQIEKIGERLDRIEGKLDEKVSLGRFREHEERFEAFKEKIEGRVGSLENTASGGVAIGRLGMWLIAGVGCTVFLAAVTLLASVISGGHNL